MAANKIVMEKLMREGLSSSPEGIKNSLEFVGEVVSKNEEFKGMSTHDMHQILVGIMRSWVVKGIVTYKEEPHNHYTLTTEGDLVKQHGAPECQVLKAIPEEGIEQKSLMALFPGNKIGTMGFSQCFKGKHIRVETVDKKTKIVHKLSSECDDTVQSICQSIADDYNKVDAAQMKLAMSRKLVTCKQVLVYEIRQGPNFNKKEKKLATDLDVAMLRSGDWENAEFKAYNFNAQGATHRTGCLHPLMKVRTEFRKILLEMGFSEMPTNNFVESSFWNFDALFQPQQHPARDAHDTFFLTTPESCISVPEDYMNIVKDTHEKGGFGSIGYRYDWKLSEAKKNILRTHTTSVSSRVLYDLGQKYKATGVFEPIRSFSIDRVFRNESLDSTHLAEFHQVEGFVADRNLTLGDLIGTIKEFFHKIGIDDLRFKPAYNPYTEPSMEIFGYSKELKKWVEVGNSGMFRPEMLQPMGLPEDVRVIAWGLSLERPTMIKYGIGEIRSLFGPKVKLNMIQTNPIARFF